MINLLKQFRSLLLFLLLKEAQLIGQLFFAEPNLHRFYLVRLDDVVNLFVGGVVELVSQVKPADDPEHKAGSEPLKPQLLSHGLDSHLINVG